MKVIIIHDTLAIEPIRKAFAEYNIAVEEWISDETPVDITMEPPNDAIFYNRTSASSHNRNHRYSLDQCRSILRWLQKHDRIVINGLTAVELEASKIYQYLCATESGLQVPHTFIASVITEKAVRTKFGEDTPFIVKPDRGGSGIDVRRYNNLSEFVNDTEPKKYPDGLFVVQKYVPNDSGIYRAEFIGGRHIYTSRATASECGGFNPNMCPCDLPSTQYQIFKEYNHPVIQKCEKFLKNVGIENAGIEFIIDADGQPLVIDVNTNTVYNTSVENEVGLESGFMRVAKYVHSRLQKLQAREKL